MQRGANVAEGGGGGPSTKGAELSSEKRAHTSEN